MAYPSEVADIESRVAALPAKFPGLCTERKLSRRTYEGPTGGSPGRLVPYLQIGTGSGEGRARVLIVGGMHAREVAPPDAILTFVEKLLEAYKASTPLIYPRWVDPRPSPTVPYAPIRFPFPQLQAIIERTELYVLPLANPDGRDYAMKHDEWWRKNRRPNIGPCPLPPAPLKPWENNDANGVDLNRNFEIAWDFNQYFSAAAVTAMKAAKPPQLGVSDNMCATAQTYHGPAPSGGAAREIEPETANVQELITTKNINFYLDVHSAAGKFLYAWGMERNQEAHPEQTYLNGALDHTRDGPGAAYGEWLPPGTEHEHQVLGTHLMSRIEDSTGFTANDADAGDATARDARNSSRYEPVPSTQQFPGSLDFATGVSRDYAFARSIAAVPGTPVQAKALAPVMSYTFECGRTEDGGFHPDKVREYPKVEREVWVGLAEFISYAGGWRGSATPTPSAPSRCFIATAAYGSPYHPKVRYLCDIRDEELKTTEFGRRFMYGVERAYYSFSPQTAEWLYRHERARRGVQRGAVEPWIAIVWTAETLTHRVRPAELRAAAFLSLVTVATLAAIAAIALLMLVLALSLASLV
jgi:murein tripeptide amidase MpaA